MTQARRHLVPPQSALTVHCVQRCVRRAFLCGLDHYSGKSFEHRKDWVEARLLLLADCFAVALHGYAVMSNHLHLVLQVEPAVANAWADDEVATRWLRLFPASDDDGTQFKRLRLLASPDRLAICRARLGDLSWFMRCLAEPLARQANVEDGCKGRFWEGRFKCQRLLDDRAVLAAMAYVDLNPIRAGITSTLAGCSHTSLARRMADQDVHQHAKFAMRPVAGLPMIRCLPISLDEYVQLVDWTGQQLAPGKRGMIRGPAPHALAAMGAQKNFWAVEVRGVGSRYWRAIGSAERLVALAESLGQQWLKGVGFARSLKKV